MPKQIKIEVGTDGAVKIATSGFAGAECQKATADLERALGLKTSDTATAEMHHTTTRTQGQA